MSSSYGAFALGTLLLTMLSICGAVSYAAADRPFLWPISGDSTIRDTITSPFGIRTLDGGHYYYNFHRGIDLRTRTESGPLGSVPVYSIETGFVIDYSQDPYSGKYLVIQYSREALAKNLYFIFAHLDQSFYLAPIQPNTLAIRGDTIAMSGRTGATDQYHLHMGCQVRPYLDPFDKSLGRNNPLVFYPLPASSDNSPAISDTQLVSVGDSVDYVCMSIEIDRSELDLSTIAIFLYHPTSDAQHIVSFQFSWISVGFWQAELGGDTLRWSEISADSLFEFFQGSEWEEMHTHIVLSADRFYCDIPQPQKLNLTIDPVDRHFPSANNFGVRVIDLAGHKTDWGRVPGPNITMNKFISYFNGEWICIDYQFSYDCVINHFEIIRYSNNSAVTVYRVDSNESAGLLGASENRIIDSTANAFVDYEYRAFAVSDIGLRELIGSCKYHALPVVGSLIQNHPNPFNSSTIITFFIEGSDNTNTTVVIYDLLGRTVKILHNGLTAPGKYIKYWDGTDENGHLVASGVYFYRLKAGDYVETKKMMLIR